ncbi:MAG: hypothetical protein NXH84_09610 [Rhodobacteraceae bacterium]|jgi:hypothetical protein|nr:hypothetical protein [Paracoccaceae bacterium]
MKPLMVAVTLVFAGLFPVVSHAFGTSGLFPPLTFPEPEPEPVTQDDGGIDR